MYRVVMIFLIKSRGVRSSLIIKGYLSSPYDCSYAKAKFEHTSLLVGGTNWGNEGLGNWQPALSAKS